MYLKIQKAATLLDVSYNTVLKWVRDAGLHMKGKGIKGEGREVPFHALLIYLYQERKLWYLRGEKGSKEDQDLLFLSETIEASIQAEVKSKMANLKKIAEIARTGGEGRVQNP